MATSTPSLVLVIWTLLCQAASSATGGAEWSFPLLEITESPRSAQLVAGESTLLPCSWRAARTPAVTWTRDGVPLELGPGRSLTAARPWRLHSNGTLEVAGRDGAGAGRYQCRVSLAGAGTLLSTPATLRPPAPPVFTSEPSSLTVYQTQTAVFSCSLATEAALTWTKNGRELELDPRMTVLPSGSLEITNVNYPDRGRYRCEAKQLGLASREADLNLQALVAHAAPEAPQFLATPRAAVSVEVGGEVTLECAANGLPQPQITWLRGGRELQLSEAEAGARYSISGSGSLVIRGVEAGDEGGYQCRAENTEDSLDTGLELAVVAAPRLVRGPQHHVSYEKDDILLECEVAGRPEPEVRWYKNGDLIIQSEYFQIVRGTSLRILGLVTSDAGVYQCIASNSVASVQAAAQLQVRAKADSTISVAMSSPRPVSMLGPGPGLVSLSSVAGRAVPGPPTNLEAVITSTRFITLAWEPPSSNTAAITGYSVYYQQEGSERERVINSTRGTLEEISVQGLQPGTSYRVRVVAQAAEGPGSSSPEVLVRTQQEVLLPGPPSNLTARPTSAFSILVMWDPPSQHQEDVLKYKLYHRHGGEFSREQEVEVSGAGRQYHLTDLREFTEYSFRVAAFNQNGEGGHSEEISCRTYSDIPADPPQNVTVEPASSSSVIVRWEPPPKESQNGVLTGYKLKWRKAGKGSGSGRDGTQTVSTDGSRRLYAISGLAKGKQYQVKISALTVNGSGPATSWLHAYTFESDLDESVVPDPPSSLRAKASDDSIAIMWKPPSSNKILVRGYTIGWGKGIPDEYTKVVDNKQRYFVIEDLKPNSEYVISLRAYNNIGDGRPIYETTRTRDEEIEAARSPLVPPVGLHAIVLSASTVVLTWVDSTLPRNQLVTDNRYYIVRYTSTASLKADRPKHNYRNSTDLNAMLDDLRPNTQYEFTVKVVKGPRQSPWSLVVYNSTQEAAPESAPRDLAVIGNQADPSTVTLTWLPPRRNNGKINGYVVFYTVDRRREDREWVVEGVVGDKTNTEVRQLDPDTRYYFKIQARNSKGYGPLSSVVQYRTKTGAVAATSQSGSSAHGGAADSGIPAAVQYAIFAAGGVIVLAAVVFGLVMCRRGSRLAAPQQEQERHNKPYLKGEQGTLREKLNPPPPDLWINHDQLELKSIDSNQEDTGRGSSLMRSTPIDLRGSSSTLDRSRYIAPYSAVTSSVPASQAGSTYIRSQYNLNPPPVSGAGHHSPDPLPGYCPGSEGPPSTIGDFNWGNTTGTGSSLDGGSVLGSCNGCHHSGNPGVMPPHCGGNPGPHPAAAGGPGTAVYLSSAMSDISSADSGSVSGSGSRTCGSNSGGSGSAGGGSRRPSNFKSFTNHPPSGMTQPKAVFVRPQPSSPFKRPLLSSTPNDPEVLSPGSGGPPAAGPGATVNPRGLNFTPLPAMAEVRSPDVLHPQDGPCDCLSQPGLQAGYSSNSTEELNNEMRNLESVMKDLNAIATPHQCQPATHTQC